MLSKKPELLVFYAQTTGAVTYKPHKNKEKIRGEKREREKRYAVNKQETEVKDALRIKRAKNGNRRAHREG